MYTLDKEKLKDYAVNNGKCYCMANGVGGYTSGSVINSFNRKHYGYLVASLKAPVERMMLLGKIDEELVLKDKTISFETQEYASGITDHHECLKEFIYDENPCFTYEAEGITIRKEIAPVYGKNRVAITYVITSDEDFDLRLTPYFNWRDHGDVSKKENLRFKEKSGKGIYTLVPEQNSSASIVFAYSEGKIVKRDNACTEPVYFQYDFETGDDRYDTYYTPVSLAVPVKAGEEKRIGILCGLNSAEGNAFQAVKDYKERIRNLRKNSGLTDEFALDLVQSADTFITDRVSTGLKTILAGLPWFTDWGRDTMISFTGLTLVTRRFSEAREILKSFSLYEKNGLIPNMFPDDGGEPMYNTVDASLWYFYACFKYIEYTGDKKFILDEIYPVLQSIIKNYMKGTSSNIHMDEDFLISCGDRDTQITWMDVKTNGIAVTPRFGKPVEIEALWYNALCVMAELSRETGDAFDYSGLARKVKESFNQKFYCPETGCLYDTADPYDSRIRPNQCFVFEMPFKVLDEKYAEGVFEVITRDLYNVYGLRSLSPKDPGFKPRYEGKLLDRDFAYHMGTTWGFLIGCYFDGYAYVHRNSPDVKKDIEKLAKRISAHLSEGCLYGFAEIFDGDTAGRTRGCYTQAWSIGELLRSYYENVIR